MSDDLKGKKIAILTANEGVEQVELYEPRKALEEAGATVEHVATEKGEGQLFEHLDKADTVEGRTLPSYPSVRPDIENAGGKWVDEEVVVDQALVPSRRPDDLPA